MPTKEDLARAQKFNIPLTQIGRVVFRGLGGDSEKICPKAIFKAGFNWNYNGLQGDPAIYPSMGTVTGMISTSKRPETAMYYAAMQKQNNTSKYAWIYAIYCSHGVDYSSAYINNPMIQKGGVIKSNAPSSFSIGSNGQKIINMSNKGEGNQEIIMVNVSSAEVLCAKAVEHELGDVFCYGEVQVNKNASLRKTNPALFKATVDLLASYSRKDKFRFEAFSPDRYKFR